MEEKNQPKSALDAKAPAQGGNPPKEEKNQGKDTVQVPKEDLKNILDTLESQGRKIEEQANEVKRLSYAADKSRLAKWDQDNPGEGELIRRYKLSTFEGKVILAWENFLDNVDTNDRKITEDQMMRITLADGAKKEMTLLQFARTVKKVWGELVQEKKTKGGTFYTIRLKDGAEYEVEKTFVN